MRQRFGKDVDLSCLGISRAAPYHIAGFAARQEMWRPGCYSKPLWAALGFWVSWSIPARTNWKDLKRGVFRVFSLRSQITTQNQKATNYAKKESDRDLQSKRVFVYLVARPVARISRMRFQGCFFDRFWNLHFAPRIPKLCAFDILLTGLDMEALLRELQIPVYYAPEHATTRFPPAETAALQHADFASQEIKIWSDISVSYH